MLRSNETTLAWLLALVLAWMAAIANGAPSATMVLIDGSCCSLAPMVAWTDGRSVPLT